MIRKLIILSGAAFTIGNIVWPLFNEPKIFYVPLALFLFFLIWEVKKQIKQDYEKACMDWLFMLAAGNIIKQVFYTKEIAQINDYVWGATITIWLLYKLSILWATQK